MMMVWAVIGVWDYDGEAIIGIYSTEAKALEKANMEKDTRAYDYFNIEVYSLDDIEADGMVQFRSLKDE
jgi:hypothetical protein